MAELRGIYMKSGVRGVFLLVGLLAVGSMPAVAVSRLGGVTDDSVCDLGSLEQRQADVPSAAAFVKAKCKNGQLLMGKSVVPLGSGQSEIMNLARAYCRIADIQVNRIRGGMMGVPMEWDEVRCPIAKLKTD
jgi:hypothetical protein